MKYIEVSVSTTTLAADLVADVLFSLGAGGVSVDDPADVSDVINNTQFWDYVEEGLLQQREDVFVRTLIAEDEAEEFVKALHEELAALKKTAEMPLGKLAVTKKTEEGVDWREEWRKHFKPIVTKNITVVPCWIDYEKQDSENIILIEPGMAFGTGEHETTRMCLELMPDVQGKVVIDVGCGSGILGVSAAILGAEKVFMSDIDPSAVASAKENASLNNIPQEKIDIRQSDLLQDDSLKGDVIFANITADILINLSKNIVKHLNLNGEVILSGIIHSRLEDVKSAYEEAGLTAQEVKTDGEWNAIIFKRDA